MKVLPLWRCAEPENIVGPDICASSTSQLPPMQDDSWSLSARTRLIFSRVKTLNSFESSSLMIPERCLRVEQQNVLILFAHSNGGELEHRDPFQISRESHEGY